MSHIHPTAVVHPDAKIHSSVTIDPYVVIGPHVSIGEDTRIMAHTVIDGHTTIGARCEIFPMASIGQKTQDLKFTGGTCYLVIGDDNTIREFVTINTATEDGGTTRIGNHNHIMAYCHIAHNCVIGNHVIMSNLATLAGHITVEDYVVIGGMGGLHQFVRIGMMSMVGACTKITQDVTPYTIVEGNPAAPKGLNSVRMKRLDFSTDTLNAIKKAYRLIYREGLQTKEAVARIRAELDAYPEALRMADFVENTERGLVR